MAIRGIEEKVLVQVCVIVRDVEQKAKHYQEIFGLGPGWDFQITRPFDHTQATYYGQPSDARAKITGFQMGAVAFELLQPLDSPSVWMDYLEKQGEGIQHVTFFVPRTAPTAASFVDHGYKVTQQGMFTDREGMYTYLDTDCDLGITIELLEHYYSYPQPITAVFPADKGIGTDLIGQVGLITDDIDTMVQRYREVLDLPTPLQITTPGYDITETRYRGEATANLAFFDFGQLQLELIQPDAHPSIWREHLEARGASAQQIAFQVDDSERVIAHFAKHGIGVAQQGLYGDRSGMYTYMDSAATLGVIIELLETFDAPR